jgi:hypothetical protein
VRPRLSSTIFDSTGRAIGTKWRAYVLGTTRHKSTASSVIQMGLFVIDNLLYDVAVKQHK